MRKHSINFKWRKGFKVRYSDEPNKKIRSKNSTLIKLNRWQRKRIKYKKNLVLLEWGYFFKNVLGKMPSYEKTLKHDFNIEDVYGFKILVVEENTIKYHKGDKICSTSFLIIEEDKHPILEVCLRWKD